MRKKEGRRRRRGREEEGGWTDGGVGPQRRVIHHTTMQSALVQPLFLFLCRSFFSSSSSSSSYDIFPLSLSLFPFIHPVVYYPSIAVRLLDIFPSSTRLPSTPKNNLSFFFFPPSFFFFFFGCSVSLSLPSSSLAVVFRFHHLLWRHSSFLLSIFSHPPSFSFTLTAFSFCPFSLSEPKKKSLSLSLFYVFHLWIK